MNRNVSSIVLVAVMCIMMIAPATAQEPASPFVISGYVFDSDGDPCNDPSVAVMNTSTSMSEDAKKSLGIELLPACALKR